MNTIILYVKLANFKHLEKISFKNLSFKSKQFNFSIQVFKNHLPNQKKINVASNIGFKASIFSS